MLFLTQFARAESLKLFIEPYVGFSKLQVENMQTKLKDISDNFIIGITSGFHITRVFYFGIDYHSGGPYKFNSVVGNGNWSTRSLGATAGLEYKVIRFFYSYFVNSEITDSTNNYRLQGYAQKFGISLPLSQKIKVNLEVLTYHPERTVYTNSTTNSSIYDPKETNAYISVPVDLF